MIFLERTREGHRQSDEQWNRFKGNVGDISETGWSAYQLSRARKYQPELKFTGNSLLPPVNIVALAKWNLKMEEPIYALHTVSRKFPQRRV